METIKKKYGRTKSISEERKSVTAHVSTYSWDRTTERFVRGAWDLKNYLSNPVVLWGHDQTQLPIGKADNIIEDETGLLTETIFDKNSEFAMKVFDLYRNGFLNAFSVGFIPKEYKLEPLVDGSDEKGIVFTNAELLEYSAVSVPANPGAVVSRSFGEKIIKTLGEKALVETKIGEESVFIIPIGPQRFNDKKELLSGAIAEKPGDIETSLRYVMDLAAAAKTQGLPEGQVGLIKQAIEVFQELIPAGEPVISPEVLEGLANATKALGAAVLAGQTEVDAKLIEKMNRQLDQALKAGRSA